MGDVVAVGLLNACAFVVALLLLALSPGGDGRYAVLAAGRPGAMEVAAAAGGSVLAASGRVAVVHSDAPDFRARLMAAGATLVFNPLLAAGCREADAGTPPREQHP